MQKLPVIALILYIFTISCTNNKSHKVLFDIDSLQSPKQQIALHLSYFYKDTLRPLAIYRKNDSLIYRLNVRPLSMFRNRIGKDSLLSQLLLDSTNNGGRSWSKPMEIFNIRQDLYNRDLQFHFENSTNNFVGSFFVGHDGTKYIASDDASENKVYIIKGNQVRTIATNDRERIQASFFDENINQFVFLTREGGGFLSGTLPQFYYNRLCDGNIKKHKLPLDTAYTGHFFAFSKDTLYMTSIISEYSEKAGLKGFLLQKIDTSGTIVETSAFPSKWVSTESWWLAIFDNTYHLVGDVLNMDDPSNKIQVIFSSEDFGKNWSAIPVKKPLFILSSVYFEKEGMVISDDYGSMGVMTGFDGNVTPVSDTAFYSDSIQHLDIMKIANAPFILGTNERDSLDKYHCIFIPRLLNSSAFGKLTYYQVDESSNNIDITIYLTKGTITDNQYKFRLFDDNVFDPTGSALKEIPARFKPINADSTEWKCSFSPANIGLSAGEPYKLQIYFSNHTKEERYNLPRKAFAPVSFYTKHQMLLNALIGLGIVLLVLFLLFFFAPYALYKFHKKINVLEGIASLDSTLGKVLLLANKITIVPLFVFQPRVADAWAACHQEALVDSFEKLMTVKIRKPSYVPIPIRVQSPAGELVNEPVPSSLSKFFNADRLCIEIIGPGGIGKTTLAVQMGVWSSNSVNAREFKNHLWLPILVEEETSDLFAVIKGTIKTYTDDDVDDEFLRYLLRKQRILVIVDALSERSLEMQQYIRTLYRQTMVNAMVITSRKPINIFAGEDIFLYPQKMDFVKVAEYVKTVLSDKKEEVFAQETTKSKISDKIVSLFNIGNKEVPILPVLPALVMRRAILLVEEFGNVGIEFIINNLPSSIPEIFIDYITSVNPKSGDNLYDDDLVLEFCMKMSVICLGDDFRPTDFLKSALGPIPTTARGNILDRLAENGVLLPMKRFGNDYILRFALDPIAEYLATMVKAKETGADTEKWNKLFDIVESRGALEFKSALEVVQVTYAEKLGWWKKAAHVKDVPSNEL